MGEAVSTALPPTFVRLNCSKVNWRQKLSKTHVWHILRLNILGASIKCLALNKVFTRQLSNRKNTRPYTMMMQLKVVAVWVFLLVSIAGLTEGK